VAERTGKGNPRMRYRGTAKATAMSLFAVARGRKMETPEQRETIALVFKLSDKPAIQALAQDAMNPLFKRTSFASLAERHALNIHMLSDEFKAIMRSDGLMRAAQHLPEIIEQVAVDAKSRDQRCSVCNGTGEITSTIGKRKSRKCVTCDGRGTKYVLGDIDRLKLLFETFGLSGKSGGLNVNLDLRKIPEHESMSDLSESIAPLLEGSVKP
jgi:hypothetical protein